MNIHCSKVGLRSKWRFEDVIYETEWHNPIPFKERLLKLPQYFHTHSFSLPLNVKEMGKRPSAQKLHMDTYPFFHVFVKKIWALEYAEKNYTQKKLFQGISYSSSQ